MAFRGKKSKRTPRRKATASKGASKMRRKLTGKSRSASKKRVARPAKKRGASPAKKRGSRPAKVRRPTPRAKAAVKKQPRAASRSRAAPVGKASTPPRPEKIQPPAPRIPRARRKARRPKAAPSAAIAIAPEPSPSPLRDAKLGTKHACFACQTKFYDMNRPEPICPKCGADQRERPKEAAASPQPLAPAEPPARQVPRPMAPLLDEDEDLVPYEADVDLGITRVDEEDSDDDVYAGADVEGDEDEDFDD